MLPHYSQIQTRKIHDSLEISNTKATLNDWTGFVWRWIDAAIRWRKGKIYYNI